MQVLYLFIKLSNCVLQDKDGENWDKWLNCKELDWWTFVVNKFVHLLAFTGLYELWKTGRYRSYPPSVLVDLVARILALVPPWTRVYRVQRSVGHNCWQWNYFSMGCNPMYNMYSVFNNTVVKYTIHIIHLLINTIAFWTMDSCMTCDRDIPMPLVSSGVEHGNLRELALARMKDLGTQCRDIRTREVGIQEIHHKVRPYEVVAVLLCVLCILLGMLAIYHIIASCFHLFNKNLNLKNKTNYICSSIHNCKVMKPRWHNFLLKMSKINYFVINFKIVIKAANNHLLP